jgi:hypothetical protein
MGITRERSHRASSAGTVVCLMLLAIGGAAARARAQSVEIQSFEVTPFIGARLGGTFATQVLTGSLGVTHVGAARDAFTRFSFGFGAGLKQFLGSSLAIRAEAQGLPILIEPSVSGFACGTIQFGGCLVVLNADLVQQFQLSIGPVVRF